MELLIKISAVTGAFMSIVAFISLFFKPAREKLLDTKTIKEGQKCLLRSEMLRIYYEHNKKDTIGQFEFENFMMLYNAYKSLGGNSFIDKVKEEVKNWEVEN